MKTDVSCYRCHSVLGSVGDGINPIVFPMAVNVAPQQMLFSIKCPACGTVNHIKLTRNDIVDGHNDKIGVRKY